MLEDTDANMLEDVLQRMDLSKGLAILIDSSGGDILAAERIIRTCRKYSGTDDYWTIVPGKAKSAATTICLGASKIIMSGTSELGPVGPQLTTEVKGERRRFSLRKIVDTYEDLFNEARELDLEEENLEPFIQQLDNFDAREISEFKSSIELSESVAIQALKEDMMSNHSEEKIREKIGVFLEPDSTKAHGRPIYFEKAEECDLNVEEINVDSNKWKTVYELHTRLRELVSSSKAAKCVESEDHFFFASPPEA